jgi:hypothetical protein
MGCDHVLISNVLSAFMNMKGLILVNRNRDARYAEMAQSVAMHLFEI